MDRTTPTVTGGGARRPELAALMSLRFVFAVGVFLLHLSVVTGASLHPGARVEQWPSSLQVFHEGYYRQTFFLMLSGFVLTYVYADALRERPRGFHASFLVKRVARIWPLHALMLLVMVPGAIDTLVLEPVRVAFAFLANATLLHGWFSTVPVTADANFADAFNGPSWALSAELLCYALFPVLGSWLLARVGTRGALLATVGVWGVVLALGVASEALPRMDTAIDLVYLLPAARLLDFLDGILIGIVFLGWTIRAGEGAQWGSGGRSIRWTGLELGAIGLLVAAIALRADVALQVRLVAWYLPVMAVILFVFACARGHLSLVLSWAPFVALGRLSFAFYLVHFPMLVYAQAIFGFRGTRVSTILLLFATCVAAAWVLNRTVEGRARDVIVNRWNRRVAARAAVSAAAASGTWSSVDDHRDAA